MAISKQTIIEENDIEKLKEYALLYSKSNEYQAQIIEMQKKLIAQLEGDKQSSLFNIEKIQLLNKKVFGRSSEKKRKSDETRVDYDFNVENLESTSVAQPKSVEELDTEEVVHELSKDEQFCLKCNSSMTEMKNQYEESEEITILERSFKKLIHKRKKYRCKCNAYIKTAPVHAKLIEGGKYSTDFSIHVAVGKYADHLPLERQATIMKREGLVIKSQTLWEQIQALSHHLLPVYRDLHSEVLSSDVLHIDETRWEMLCKNPKRWQLWGMCNSNSVFYNAVDTRSGNHASKLLSKYTGIVVCDAYIGYKSASGKENVKWKLAGCWAHSRRKFVEVENNYPDECVKILDLIGELFKIENKAESYKHLTELRAIESKNIIAKIKLFMNTTKALPGSGLFKAINYTKNNWQELTIFLTNVKIPLTNNAAERALRGPVVGRKNHYGSKSPRGAKTSAILYSIMESCKTNKINAVKYLQHVIPIRLKKEKAPTPYEYSKIKN